MCVCMWIWMCASVCIFMCMSVCAVCVYLLFIIHVYMLFPHAVGTFLAFDKHMNLVMGDCEEFRKIKAKKGEQVKELKRNVGMVLLRGENVVSLNAVAPPLPKKSQKPLTGPGQAKSFGRGMPPQIGGLSGPMGFGGPSMGAMAPQPPMRRM